MDEGIIADDITPFGAKYREDTKSVEFRLYSKNASRVFLEIFNNPQGEDAVMSLEMKKSENNCNVFETSVKDYVLNCHKYPVYYGFRIFGPNWEYKDDYKPASDTGYRSKFDEKGNRFNPNKLAYDPYAQELSHLPSDVNPALNIFRSGANFYLIDDAKWAPKSVFFPKKPANIARASKRAFLDEVIGEVHIKDLTQNLNMQERGTYLGAKKFAKSLKNLGITMVEFLPLNEFDYRQGGFNHWGYMPLGYFALSRRYAYNKMFGNTLNEFREMVDEFHKNNIKVCLDMVYNHTGEAALINDNPEDAVLLSYALIDNSEYYKTYPNGRYRSNSGCGNDFNTASEGGINVIVDSLVFWAKQGVDAFRFDLAAALLEVSYDCSEVYDNINSLAGNLKQRLEERGIRVAQDFASPDDGIILIAEPWTCSGADCYKLGHFPSCWAEWCDVCRDTIRKSTLRPHEITPFALKELWQGNPTKFGGVNKAVNYIACHDGFTLFDLNTYRHKNPSTQGGSNWEISGDYDGNLKLKENAIRKQLAMLFTIRGVPMIQVADIIMHTKSGNNNSYNHDDSINYLNWDKALEKNSFENRIMEYIRNLIQFRRDNGLANAKILSWHNSTGLTIAEDDNSYWNSAESNFLGILIETAGMSATQAGTQSARSGAAGGFEVGSGSADSITGGFAGATAGNFAEGSFGDNSADSAAGGFMGNSAGGGQENGGKKIYIAFSKSADEIMCSLPAVKTKWKLCFNSADLYNITPYDSEVQDAYKLPAHALCIFREE